MSRKFVPDTRVRVSDSRLAVTYLCVLFVVMNVVVVAFSSLARMFV